MGNEKYADISIVLNKTQAEFILKSIDSMPDSEKSNVNMQKLKKSIEKVVTVWRRRAKNDQIASKARVARINARPEEK